MNITGMGVVFAGGTGVPALREALLAGRPLVGAPLAKEGIPVLAVPAAAFFGSADVVEPVPIALMRLPPW